MKATSLRVMRRLMLVAAFIALVTPGTASANDLEDALEDYGAKRYEQALEKLRAYVQSNPDDKDVYGILMEADEQVLLRALAKGGDHQRLMSYLLKKARPENNADLRDAGEIDSLARQAVEESDLDKRRDARARLRPAGDLAVPALYKFLGADDAETIVNAILALRAMGSDAVEPLIEVLHSDNARVRGYAAAVLGQLGDDRAGPALLHAAAKDADESVRQRAAKAAANLGVSGDASAAYVTLGARYYDRDPRVIASFDNRKNVWRWEDGDLARYEVPSYLYPYQMAEECAADALEANADNADASSLLVRALLAQKLEAEFVNANEGEAPEALGGAFDLASSLGYAAASDALADSMEAKDWDVAIAATDLMRHTYNGEQLASSPLGDALASDHKGLRYAAAIAALRMSPTSDFPNADKVASLAAQAASESALRQVLVIDDVDATRNQLLRGLAQSGYVSSGSRVGTAGVMRAKGSPTLDVIIVAADLGDQSNLIPDERHDSSIMILDELTTDVRTKDMRIVLLVRETAERKKDAIQNFFSEKYGDKIAGFIDVPIVDAAAMSTVDTAAEAGDLNADRQRANETAANAADAFASMDFSCATFDLGVAIDPLSTAATDGPTAAIRLNAVRALGNIRVGGAPALAKVLAEGEGDELKAAAAKALGAVLGALNQPSDHTDALISAAGGEGDVAKAALVALGQVKNLTTDQRLRIFKTHRLKVATRDE